MVGQSNNKVRELREHRAIASADQVFSNFKSSNDYQLLYREIGQQKTWVMIYLARKVVLEHKKNVTFVVPLKELRKEIISRLKKYGVPVVEHISGIDLCSQKEREDVKEIIKTLSYIPSNWCREFCSGGGLSGGRYIGKRKRAMIKLGGNLFWDETAYQKLADDCQRITCPRMIYKKVCEDFDKPHVNVITSEMLSSFIENDITDTEGWEVPFKGKYLLIDEVDQLSLSILSSSFYILGLLKKIRNTSLKK